MRNSIIYLFILSKNDIGLIIGSYAWLLNTTYYKFYLILQVQEDVFYPIILLLCYIFYHINSLDKLVIILHALTSS